ncbi:SDR family NAD(P)-dependent oxidoreductase [Cupriavidus pinatubonensis]|uniref:SDR family NAD(P)-dependent oxidoreductase n=1 Tax=Cupriavidus pinatubonensis TaxID=248026 RepID=UPI00112B1CE4|nr:SDR family oxidoreductase [Cupriavidus pinatubonensis]TPQ25558.1 hypothetical protein C2U69_35545 [Cupriavidus pinatubonensis]
MERLHNKAILITGAGGGQGAALARLFASEGATLILTDLTKTGLLTLAEDLGHKTRVISMEHDVASEPAWRDVVDAVRQEVGRLDVLVNNAGMNTRHGLIASDMSAWGQTIGVNLTGPFLGMKYAAPLLAESGGGSIINVSSTAGLTAHPDAAYCASKWGLRGLTKMAATELAKFNIRVNSVHPGVIDNTSFMAKAPARHADAASYATPLGRAGTPEECAQLVMFLASEQSIYVTGAEIAIDGGYSAGATMWMRQQYQASLAGNLN